MKLLFMVYLHQLLARPERICGYDLYVAYADDIAVIVTTTQTTDEIFQLFDRFEIVVMAKSNRQKIITTDVNM